MSKFCTKCGKKLEEGVVCNCSSKNTNQAVEPIKKQSTKVDVKESFMDCVNVFKKIFTKPMDAIKEFVCDNKFISGIIMVVVAAITSGLYKLATLKSMYSASSSGSFNVDDFSSLLDSALSGNLSVTRPEYFKEFLTTFATSLVEYTLIIFIGYLLISKLMKGGSTWKQMITAVAISLSVVLIGNVVNSILVFIDGDFIGNIRSYIASFASISSILFLFVSIKEIAEIDKNKLFMSVASMFVLATVIIDIAKKIFN